MKTRESGMPEEAIWQGFFCPEAVLKKLGLTSACHTWWTSAAATARSPSRPLASFRESSTPWTSSPR